MKGEKRAMYEKYDKNGKDVWVRKDLKGRQKEFCMCWDCARFMPESADKGCATIKTVLELAARNAIVLPVWECPGFQQRQ